MVHGVNVSQMQMPNICAGVIAIAEVPALKGWGEQCVVCMNECDLPSTLAALCHPSKRSACLLVGRLVGQCVCVFESWCDFVVTNDLLSACNGAGYIARIHAQRPFGPIGFDSYFRFKCCGWMLRMCVYVILSVLCNTVESRRVALSECVCMCTGTRWFVIAFARLRHWMLLEP